MSHRVDKDGMQIESEIAQHLVHKSDFNFVNTHLLNYVSYRIGRLGNHGNMSSELPEKGKMHCKQGY